MTQTGLKSDIKGIYFQHCKSGFSDNSKLADVMPKTNPLEL